MEKKCCAYEYIKERVDNNIDKLHFIKKYPIGEGQFGRVSKIINNNVLLFIIIGLESTI